MIQLSVRYFNHVTHTNGISHLEGILEMMLPLNSDFADQRESYAGFLLHFEFNQHFILYAMKPHNAILTQG